MSNRTFAVGFLCIVFVTAFAALQPSPGARAHAASGQVGHVDVGAVQVYSADVQTGAFRANIVQADSLSVANLTSTTTGPTSPPTAGCCRFTIGSVAQGCRANITVWAHFTAAGQTCQVALLYEDLDSTGATTDVPGPSVILTLTAGSWTDAAGKFISQPGLFDSAGAAACRVVLVTAPASGRVDLHVGSS